MNSIRRSRPRLRRRIPGGLADSNAITSNSGSVSVRVLARTHPNVAVLRFACWIIRAAIDGAQSHMPSHSSSHISVAFTHVRKGVARLTTRYKQKPSNQDNPFGPLGGRTRDEQRRRACLLQDMYGDYSAEATRNVDHLTYPSTHLPDWWVNERLEARGECWRVQSVDGFRYEVYDIGAAIDRNISTRNVRPSPD